jgi:nucleotide-binding universal stress UspA family protein
MSARLDRQTVVVAADHDSSSDDAVEWAAAEAAARRSPLLVLHAIRRPLIIDPYGLIPVAADPGEVPLATARVLHAAVARARSVAPELRVFADLVPGPPVGVLLAQSRSAGLLVLGGRRRGLAQRLLRRSVAGQVTAGAHCPVVVIGARLAKGSAPIRPRVIVGVGAEPSCIPAIGFAFQAAAQRGIPLRAVHACNRDAPADLAGMSDYLAASEAVAAENLDRVLSGWRDRFPDVRVETQTLCASPTAALIGESAGAALVVVGSRGRGAIWARLFGSVSRTVVREARSPVAVIGPDGPVRTRSWRRRHHSPKTDAA